MMRDRELVQRIKDATNLAEIVGQTVKLRQQGNAWIGLCPFHSERTPSFHVIPDKGFYHCFGCNKHGDAFTWLMEREGLNFAEAKEQLAKAAGIELPRIKADYDFAKEDLNNRIRSALEIAQSYFQRSFNESGSAQDYLRQRGINNNFAREAGFGLAPNGWENVINLLRQHNFSTELIEQTGLAVRNDRGNLRDFMRHRLTIPIHDTRGRLVAFGGRALGDDKPKYLNTRETQKYKKSETLFGFHRAKGHMRDGALLVEGYFDVLQLHQEGINQAIAPLGTALAEDQLKTITKFTRKIVLCFDGDAAGQRATERTLKLALPLGFDVRLLVLPTGEDPDTWCIKLGADGFRAILRQAPDWVGFLLNRTREGRDIKRISDRMEIFQTFVTFFAFMPRTPENWSLLQSVAAELGIPKHELSRALSNQAASQTQKHSVAQTGTLENLDIDDLLRPLIILCRNPGSRQEIFQLPVGWWDYLKGALILQTVLDSDGDDSLLPDELLGPLRKLEATWASKEDSGMTIEKAIFNLEKAYVFREIKLGIELLKSPEILADPDSKDRLEKRQTQLLQRKSLLLKNNRL
ncbi:MAG: DNA primase [Holophagales bacterium]|jgi:DNA primase|nr:DNA primase [Holophagales bacterium]